MTYTKHKDVQTGHILNENIDDFWWIKWLKKKQILVCKILKERNQQISKEHKHKVDQSIGWHLSWMTKATANYM